ncbi:MAG: hypothetical protein PSX79_15475 [bacterium]|nr:hypothetical protein [bacterium]
MNLIGVLAFAASLGSVPAPPPAPVPEAVAPVVAKMNAIAGRATVIEAITGMAEVDRAMRVSMLEATSKLPSAQRASLQAQAGAVIIAQDRVHVERLKNIIAAHGWPKISETSERTATAAVTLANHAGFDLDFQRRVLSLIEPLAKVREARPEDYARMYDRLATVDRRPQRYGTQGTTCREGKYAIPADLEAPEGLDARRAAVGLQPMAESLAELDKLYGACIPLVPIR